MTNFTRKARSTGPKFAVEDDRAADPVSDHHVKQVAAASTGADFVLAISGGVGVVFQLHSQTGCTRQFAMKIFDHGRRKIARSHDTICLSIHQTWNCNANCANSSLCA